MRSHPGHLRAAAGRGSSQQPWDLESLPARALLADRAPAALLDVLLDDGESDVAWELATTGTFDISSARWVRLAEAREPTAAGDALEVYLRVADEVLVRSHKSAYRDAIGYLKAARRAATTANRRDEFAEHLADLRERNRRRPSFIAMLDRAGLP